MLINKIDVEGTISLPRAIVDYHLSLEALQVIATIFPFSSIKKINQSKNRLHIKMGKNESKFAASKFCRSKHRLVARYI